MTAKEFHIEFDQSMNQVSANNTRKYLKEEKDWILNKIMNRFIQSRFRPKKDGGGFELDQLSADSIRTLIVTEYNMVPYIDGTNSRYKCFLPPNYAYLLGDWSYTKKICSVDDYTEETKALYVRAVRQDYSSKGSSKYYVTEKVEIDGKTVTIPDDLPYGHNYIGYSAKSDISFLVPVIAAKGVLYWENAGDINKPGYYLSLSENAPSPATALRITIDGTQFNTTYQETLTFTVNPMAGVRNTNRLMPSDKVSNALGTPFFQSSHYSPISEISGNLLYVYNDNSFTISRVGITYVRKPLPISLDLNISCELPEQFHQAICDLAVLYAKGRLQNGPGYELTQADLDKVVLH